jgi:hypothetical protein
MFAHENDKAHGDKQEDVVDDTFYTCLWLIILCVVFSLETVV